MARISEKLRQLGFDLPEAAHPAANYVSYLRSGNILFISGQISQLNGQPTFLGRLGGELDIEAGRKAAEAAALGVVAQIVAATDDRLSAVRQILKLGVFVASTPEFTAQSQVANGASDLMVSVFGDAGRHARTTAGVSALPRGVSVEVDAIMELVERDRDA